MGKIDLHLSGEERTFDVNDIIVSKTDLQGRITYANSVFLRVAGYSEAETLGQPHSLVRHPDMPRAVFKLLWDTLNAGQEIFAYVINRAKNGDHYWVLAHVTPSRNAQGEIVSYHSSRRTPNPKVVSDVVAPLYRQLVEIEQSHANAKDGMMAAFDAVLALLKENGMSYDEFVFSLDAN